MERKWVRKLFNYDACGDLAYLYEDGTRGCELRCKAEPSVKLTPTTLRTTGKKKNISIKAGDLLYISIGGLDKKTGRPLAFQKVVAKGKIKRIAEYEGYYLAVLDSLNLKNMGLENGFDLKRLRKGKIPKQGAYFELKDGEPDAIDTELFK